MTDLRRGRLRDPATAPVDGEHVEMVIGLGGAVVEQILSSASPEPMAYLQDHDEWVVVLEGAATLEVAGERVDLAAGDWLLIPASTPHHVVATVAGTNWLAVHGRPG